MQMGNIAPYHSDVSFPIITNTFSYELFSTSLSEKHNFILGMFMPW